MRNGSGYLVLKSEHGKHCKCIDLTVHRGKSGGGGSGSGLAATAAAASDIDIGVGGGQSAEVLFNRIRDESVSNEHFIATPEASGVITNVVSVKCMFFCRLDGFIHCNFELFYSFL